MKTSLLTLLLTAFGLWAQTPAPPPAFPAFPTYSDQCSSEHESSSKPCNGRCSARLKTGPTLPPRASASTPSEPAAGTDASAPGAGRHQCSDRAWSRRRLDHHRAAGWCSAGATNALAEETIPPGMIDFRQADLNQVLDIYSCWSTARSCARRHCRRRPSRSRRRRCSPRRRPFRPWTPCSALNGITMVNVGDKFVKALPEAQSISAGAPFDTNSAAILPELGQYRHPRGAVEIRQAQRADAGLAALREDPERHSAD